MYLSPRTRVALAVVLCATLASAQSREDLFRRAVAAERAATGPEDFAAAAQLYQSAANQGHAGAKAALGFLYERGSGVARDPAAARRLYMESADAGDMLGRYLAASLLLRSRAGGTDADRAREYLSLNGVAGDQVSQMLLASALLDGSGGQRNVFAAQRWFKAASKGPDATLARQAADAARQIEEKVQRQTAPTGVADFAALAAVVGGLMLVAGSGPGSSTLQSTDEANRAHDQKMARCRLEAALAPSKEQNATYWRCMGS